MSLFFRSPAAAEERAIDSLPWSHGEDSPLGSSSLEGGLGLVPVYAAVRLISDSVASLPMQAYRKTPGGRDSITLPPVFAQPDPNGTRVDWLGRCMTSLLLRGNAYGLQSGLDGGMSRSIQWLHPDKVKWQAGAWTFEGREITQPLIHIPALVVPGQRLGISPLQACAAAVTAGRATQDFMTNWHRNKAVPSVHMKNTEQATLDPGVARTVKERAVETMRAGEPFVTGKDWDLTFMSLTADDAGFVQSAKLTATQVATIYGIPPAMIGGEAGGSLTYSTVELNQIQFLTNTLRPWLVRLEEAFSALMPRPQYVKFNVDSLIRVETKTRYEVHKIAREIGLENIDEQRALEDRPPLPDGKGQDYTPLTQMGAARSKEAR